MRGGDFPDTVPRSPTGDAGRAVRARDRGWPARLHTAYAAAASVLALALVLDGWDGTLTAWRALAWTGLAALLFCVLLPPRTTAGAGWLRVRGLARGHRVRTDLLVAAVFDGRVDRRLLLRDALGNRVAVEVAVLLDNPFLWHEVDAGARRSRAAGLLPHSAALRDLAERIDAAEARRLLSAAGIS
jgi:hypothetical protein